MAHEVVLLVEQLVDGHLPPSASGRQRSQLVRYSMNILGSRLAVSVEPDERQQADLITKKLMKASRERDAVRFADLARRLSVKPVLHNKWAILHLLDEISESGAPTTSFFTSLLPNVEVQSAPTFGKDKFADEESQTPRTKTSDEVLPLANTNTNRARQRAYKQYVSAMIKPEVSEDDLLRDIVFTFQGIDGKHIHFDGSHGYLVDPEVSVPPGSREVVARLGELGSLFRRVQTCLERRGREQVSGLVSQAFCAALQQEVSDYFRLLAVVEAQIAVSADPKAGGTNTTTLRRLLVWTRDPVERMKLMCLMLEGCEGTAGGALASQLHLFALHGDPQVSQFVAHILKQVCRPVFDMIWAWSFEGVLEDPFEEFFVAANPEATPRTMWREKYTIREEMLPSFIPRELAEEIVIMGKSINFMRQLCNEVEWTFGHSLQEDVIDLKYGETEKLQAIITKASGIVNSRLKETIISKFKVGEHAYALKRYLLLGQGDFIHHLMDLLEVDLEQPAKNVYRHNLLGVLETAIRATNAQYDDAEILDRLDVRMLEASPGDSGWDVFTLDYRVSAPIDTIFTPDTMQRYLQIFNFLWRLKRVENSLAATWLRQMTCGHHLRKMPEIQGVLTKCYTMRNELIHLVFNLQRYIMTEIEAAWGEMDAAFSKSRNLDDIIRAHDKYLDTIVRQTLLGGNAEGVLSHLASMFELILSFKDSQMATYAAAMGELDRRRSQRSRAEKRTEQGAWGITAEDEDGDIEDSVAAGKITLTARREVEAFNERYARLIDGFLAFLAEISDDGMRDLSFRLDFNEFYQRRAAQQLSTPALVPSASTG